MELSADDFGERDEIAARRPNRGRIAPSAKTDAPDIVAVAGHHIQLLRTAAIRIEDDLAAVGRVGRRCVDGRRIGQPRNRPGAQVHGIDVGNAITRQTHDHLVAVGREPRREGHARKIAENFLLPGVDIEDVDTRTPVVISEIGDFLRGR